jgi:DNA-binding MarR family transcriptional regulator
MTGTQPSVVLARELVELTLELARRVQGHYQQRVAEAGLTPGEARALLELTADPVPISALAAALRIDPPNATRLVARLTARDLVHRPPSPSDARVRAVALTPEGTRVRRRLEVSITDGNPVLSDLSGTDQTALRDLLGRLVRPAAEAQCP